MVNTIPHKYSSYVTTYKARYHINSLSLLYKINVGQNADNPYLALIYL